MGVPDVIFRGFINSLFALCALVFIAACGPADSGQASIYLPEGDRDNGEALFVTLGCAGCHNVVGADLPEPAEAGPVRVLLGSKTSSRRMSYGQLVTSVVNPSHKLASRYRSTEVSAEGESLMTSYNDIITVTQLTDLVAFLQAHYETVDRPGYKYPVYNYQSDDETATQESQ